MQSQEASHLHQELVEALSHVRSCKELARHPRFRQDREVIDHALKTVQHFPVAEHAVEPANGPLRITAWNIERGMNYEGVRNTLLHHPVLKGSDILLLSEVDYGMARSGNRHVTRDLGQDLGINAAFGPCFLALDGGNKAERTLAAQGSNTAALHGNAILSRHPLENLELIPLPNPKDFTTTKERKIGREHALAATVRTPHGPIHCASVHLSAHSSRRNRVRQIHEVLKAMDRRDGPAIIGGDFNTSTYNANRASLAILGFWRRVMMGVHYVIRNHYPYPERYFERKLFARMRAYGFVTEPFNILGGCTTHYDFEDPFTRMSLEDWVPQWCFPYIRWALRPHNGRCSFKLDWFGARDLVGHNAVIVEDLPHGFERISDHTPIVADVTPRSLESQQP